MESEVCLALPMSAGNLVAQRAYARALGEMLAWRGDPLATLQPVLHEQPEFASGWILKAWALALSTEPAAWRKAAKLLAQLGELQLVDRERDHVEAIAAFLSGCPARAARCMDTLCASWPQDPLALQAGHLVAFLHGDLRALRARVLQALPAWGADDPGFHAVLAMAAFAAEEQGDLAPAQELGHRALELEPGDGWAHHAIAHVFLMQGRHAEGLRWMASRESQWTGSTTLRVHNAWHWALFHLELGQPRQALQVHDSLFDPGASPAMVDLIDATALLCRLQLRGVDVGRRWSALAQAWSEQAEPGGYLFNDLHAQLAWLADGRLEAARANLAAQRAVAARPGDPRAILARELGVPLLAALLDAAQGRYRAAVQALLRVRAQDWRMGGSHAQRELVDLMLAELALRDQQPGLAAELAARPRSRYPLPVPIACAQASAIDEPVLPIPAH